MRKCNSINPRNHLVHLYCRYVDFFYLVICYILVSYRKFLEIDVNSSLVYAFEYVRK